MHPTGTFRAFAVVPAAGVSRRMGAPKLLLPLAGKPLIAHTLAAWLASRVAAIAVVIRTDDEPLASAVQNFCEPRLEIVHPSIPPPDMKASIQAALGCLARKFAPQPDDAVLVAPADMPGLSPAVIDALIADHARDPAGLRIPTLAGRRGHPLLLAWRLADEVHALAADQGLSALIDRHSLVEVPCDSLAAPMTTSFADIDTPEDYERLSGKELPQSGKDIASHDE